MRSLLLGAIVGLLSACQASIEPTPATGSVVVVGQVYLQAGGLLSVIPDAMIRGQIVNKVSAGRDTVATCIGVAGDAPADTRTDSSGKFVLVLFDYLHSADSVCVVVRASSPTHGDTVAVLSRLRLRTHVVGQSIKDTVRVIVTLHGDS